MDFVFLVPFLPPVRSLSLNAHPVLHVRFPFSPSSRPSTLVLLPTSRLSRSLLPRISPSIPFSSTHPFPSCSVPCIPSPLSYPLPFRPLQLPSPSVPFPSTSFPSPPVPFPTLFLSITSFPPTSRLFSRPPLPHFSCPFLFRSVHSFPSFLSPPFPSPPVPFPTLPSLSSIPIPPPPVPSLFLVPYLPVPSTYVLFPHLPSLPVSYSTPVSSFLSPPVPWK